MKNISPNLSIREIWKLHLLFKDSDKTNILEFLHDMIPVDLVAALKIMYGKREKKNMASAFLIGLEKGGFFSFEELIKAFK